MEKRPNRSIAGLARDRLSERLGGVLGATAGEVLDLLAAGDAGRHDERVRVRRLHRGNEAAVAERDGQVVVLALEAERAGHATAPGVDLADVVARPLEHAHRPPRADPGLLVA